MSAFKTVELFGGAMHAQLPSNFTDVSNFRQVPDNQEVWIDADGFTSIVFDILERVELPTDMEALKYHLHDIVEEDVERTQIWQTNNAIFAKLPQGTPAYTLFATAPPSEKQKGRDKEPDFTATLMCLIRLVDQKTDIVVVMNVPHIPGQYDNASVDPSIGKMGELLQKGMDARSKLIETFEINDWDLFVQE
ncbi:hypothetical protein MBLNU230_g1292t1 [Neophaeotheca triangularis]